MRKRIIGAIPAETLTPNTRWLALEEADVEVTSEEPGYPIESALLDGGISGWRAAFSGPQTIRLVFDVPLSLHRIRLVFVEPDVERAQEFVLRWSDDGGESYRDIVRQQWNFSPPGTTREVEDYSVDLPDATHLQLDIIPNRNGGDARASLQQLRLA